MSAGDVVNLEVWARYEEKPDYTRNIPLTLLSQFLGNTFAFQHGFEGMNALQTASSFNAGLSVLFSGTAEDEARPFAYLNYILFDENTVAISGDRVRIPESAGFLPGEEGLPDRHRIMEFTEPVIVPENGYIYIWLSNESEDTRVWFDDLKIRIQGVHVAQATDYGPFGSVLREQKTDPNEYYRYKYQGQHAEKDEETSWHHFELREYDPIIGRWTVVDPKRIGVSPYVGMYNTPVTATDPDGGGPEDWVKDNQTGQYKWLSNVTSQENTPEGYTYVGRSTKDVRIDFENSRPFYDFFGWTRPDIDFSGWPGEITVPEVKEIAATMPDLPIGPGGSVKILKNVKDVKKVVVIGEDMANRVIPYAKKIGATWFKPRSINPSNWMKNQIRWIRKQLQDPGTEIIDIGPKGKVPTSKYYMTEIDEAAKAGF